jgi:rRNA maturation RNase YbeY
METLIQFFYEEVDFVLDNERQIHDWVHDSIRSEKLEAGVVNIIFCPDDYLLDLNQRFLDRDTLTDVIAFDYGENENSISGDVFISIDRIHDNARTFNIDMDRELYRVIIHGILHLCGYSDKSAEEKAEMTALEDKYLSLLPH